jgi:hypothetical protein
LTTVPIGKKKEIGRKMIAYHAESRFKHHRRCDPLPCPLPADFFDDHHDGMLENGREHNESGESQTMNDDVITYLASDDIHAAIENMALTSPVNLRIDDDRQCSVPASLQRKHNGRTTSTELTPLKPRSLFTSTASSGCRSVVGRSDNVTRNSTRHGQNTNDFCWKAAGSNQLGFQMQKSPPSRVVVHATSSERYDGQQNDKTTTTTTTATRSSPVPKHMEHPRFQMTKEAQRLETSQPPREVQSSGGKQATTGWSNHRNGGGTTTTTTTGTITARNAELLGGKLSHVRRRMYGKIKLRGGTGVVARPTTGGAGGAPMK